MLAHAFGARVGAEQVFASAGTPRPGRRFEDVAVLSAVSAVFALGFASMEQAKHPDRAQVSPLAGLTVLPELRTLRPRLSAIAEGCDPLGLQRAFAAAMLAADPCTSGVYFIDEHFVPYTGKLPVGKGWNTKCRHAEAGRVDTVVADAAGRAVCFTAGEPAGLSVSLPTTLAELKRITGDTTRIMLGFDRGGAYPSVFTACRDGYVLGVPCSFTIQLTSGRTVRADQALKLTPAQAWNTASAGPGSKGDRTYAWVWIATGSPRHHLLVRRNLNDPTDQAYFHCYLPEGRPATLSTIIRIAGRRWPVEEDFQQGKEHFGLDHSQVRLYTALTRHLALAMAALATHAVTAARMRPATSTLPPAPTSPDDRPPADPGTPLCQGPVSAAGRVRRRLVGVNVGPEGPVGRCTLTPRARRRGVAAAEAGGWGWARARVASGPRVRVVACPKSRLWGLGRPRWSL
jgi:hypothetical protein